MVIPTLEGEHDQQMYGVGSKYRKQGEKEERGEPRIETRTKARKGSKGGEARSRGRQNSGANSLDDTSGDRNEVRR